AATTTAAPARQAAVAAAVRATPRRRDPDSGHRGSGRGCGRAGRDARGGDRRAATQAALPTTAPAKAAQLQLRGQPPTSKAAPGSDALRLETAAAPPGSRPAACS